MRHTHFILGFSLVAAALLVSASDGDQVVLETGTPRTFTTEAAVAVRL